MLQKLAVIMYSLNERLFQQVVPDLVKICAVAKSMIDKPLLFLTHQILGSLYLSIDMVGDARKVFNLMRDVAEQTRNWCWVMQSYEWMGKTLQASNDFHNAIKAFKKMMQLSWVTNTSEFEVKAFHYLAKQYFYLQLIQKSSFYQTRFLRGMLENPKSCQRTISEQLFNNKIYMSGKSDKFDREGFKVHRIEENKFIDCTDRYEEALHLIGDKEVGRLPRYDSTETQSLENLYDMDSRRVGGKLIRLGTPIERVPVAVMQSPSNNKADMMLLPGVSLADYENDRRIAAEQTSRTA